MIKEIHMKECATYDGEGASLLDCKKINFIYGANGSGKTTISSFLADSTDLKYSSSEVVWESLDTKEIKVYNRQFRETNFQKSDIEGVFTLGKANIQDIKELEEVKSELELRKKELSKNEENLSKQIDKKKKRTEEFRNDVWESIYKKYLQEFGEAFEGYKKSKEKFVQEVLRRYENFVDSIETLDTLREKSHSLYSSKPTMYDLMFLDISKEQKIMEDINNALIWGRVIVGDESIPIAKLIKQLDNSDWVRTGQKYISHSSVCPFCQRETIDEEFKMQLKQFFAGEYEKSISELVELHSRYQMITNSIIMKINNILSNEISFPVAKMDKKAFEIKKALLESQFSSNCEEMLKKIKEPGIKINLINTSECLSEIVSQINEANRNIRIHNELVQNFKNEKSKLTDEVWMYCLNEQKQLIQRYIQDIQNLDKSILGISEFRDSLKNKKDGLEQKVIEKGKNITSVQPTVNEMNRLLKAYGFTSFLIVPSDAKKNCYQIQRKDGTLVSNTLSEGEETFISFLYFMQLTKGATEADKVSAKKVIVLDDPICSLDSTILYVVSSMVKQLAIDIRSGKGDVEQLFVFTHNVFFHKEISFVNGRVSELRDVNYWIIRKEEDISKIKGYGTNNPISTSYELLWRELRESTESSIVYVQNIMRRIVENYFSMLGGKRDDYIKGKFATVEEQMICDSLFSWINDGSHTIPDDMFIDSYTDIVPKYRAVFEKLFKVTGNEAHYNMMMGIEME